MTDRPDVVVVGAGSSGAVVAARLSERGDRRVLLLEAGPDHDGARTPPAIAGPDCFAALGQPGRTWPALVATRAAGGTAQPYWQGRGVGGSSAVNGMVATWPEPAELDAWGIDGWRGDDLVPARRRAAAALTLTRAVAPGPVARALDGAAAAVGLSSERPLLTWDGRRRVSVNDAYLEPARRRRNLTIRGGATVDSVAFDGPLAAGVRLVGGEVIEAGLVVVAAGAIHSPAILLRSGIDRPGVGANLRDHPAVRVVLHRRDDERGAPLSEPPFGALVRHGGRQVLAMDGPQPGLLLALVQSHASGRVRLDPNAGDGEPVVELDQLGDERDVVALEAGVALLERLVDGPAVRGEFGAAEMPSVLDLAARLGDVFHAAGTCRLGVPTDDDAVVDPRLHVIGRRRLVVADASVMPTLPSANPHLLCVMIGERAAEVIGAG